MRRPVVRGDLVGDQVVHGLRVGHAQQRLGQAHQRHALLGGKPIGREKDLHQPRVGGAAHGLDQIHRARRDRLAVLVREARGLGQPLHGGFLVGQIVGADIFAEGV